VWAQIVARFSFVSKERQRPRAELEAAVRGCLQSCDGSTLAGAESGSIAADKIAACDAAAHWLVPFGFGALDGSCALSTAASTMKTSACFWGKCVDETELFGLFSPDTTFQRKLEQINPKDPTCGAAEPVYGTENPSTLPNLARRLMAAHCEGVVTVWVASTAELFSLEHVLRELLVFNPAVQLVDVRTTATERPAVSDAMTSMVDSWTPTLCRLHTRAYFAPFTVSSTTG
jgi:hypothetical protein